MNPRSIRVRLIGWCVAVALVLFCPSSVYIYFQVDRCLKDTLRQHLSDRAQRIGESLLESLPLTSDGYVASEIRARYSPEEDLRFIRIFRGDGTVLYSSGGPRNGEFAPADIPLPPRSLPRVTSTSLKFPNGFRMMLVNYPYHADGRIYLIQSGQTAVNNETVLHGLIIALLLGMPLFTLAALVGAYLLIGRTLASVDEVAAAAREVTLHNLKLRLPETRSGDELERLTQSFNEMIGRLDGAFQHASRFSMDASHELRTPLTIIQGELEVMVREETHPETHDKVGSLLEEVQRLNQIVRNLFLISKLEAGEATLQVAPVDFTSLVHNIEEQVSVLAEAKEISIEWAEDNSVLIDGDQSRLRQVIVNLLDNAIKYTPLRGRIELSVRAEGATAAFTVANSGSRIADESLPYLFDRFYRSHEHRFDHESGAGLGLSIVRSICAAHGGTVEAANLGDGRCAFTVRIPLLTTVPTTHVYVA